MMRSTGEYAAALRRLLSDCSGNFSIMSALILPVGLGAAGLAIDASQLIANKNALQAAADAAALATASALANETITTSQAEAYGLKFLAGQMANQGNTTKTTTSSGTTKTQKFDFATCSHLTATQTTTTGSAKKYNVAISACYDIEYSALSAFLGKDGGRIVVNAATVSTTESKNALSMYLVLDRSGSMAEYTDTVSGSYTCRYGRKSYTCYTYYDKITALKNAAAKLMTQLSTADPDTTLVRTAAVSYNSAMQTPVNLAWGESQTTSYISALTATGGTDSSLAFKAAYQALTATTEDAAHAAKNGQAPSKYIVFMTDGDNNYTSADTATKQWCDSARTAGVEVYSVAFMAPDRGKALLNYCATTSAHYFAAEDADDLNAAFEYIGERATETATRLTQ